MTMHPEARKSMLRKSMLRNLENILKNGEVKNGLLPFDKNISKSVAKFVHEAEKQKGKWMTFSDIVDVLYDYISRCIIANIEKPWEASGKLSALLHANKLEALHTDIMGYFESIPRPYIVLFELPAAKPLGVNEIPLTTDVSFVQIEKNDYPVIKETDSSGLLPREINIKPSKQKLYIRVLSDGYADGTLESSATKKAYSKFKQTVLLGKIEGVLKDIKVQMDAGSQQISVGLLTLFDPSDSRVFVYYRDNQDAEKYVFKLPKHTNNYIAQLGINEEKLKPDTLETYMMKAEFENIDAPTPKDRAKLLVRRFDFPKRLLETSDSDIDAERIKTAIEWNFESVTNENDTFAFIQACIGLEALLGDENSQEDLTNTLADRCAYLIGQSISERKKLKNDFKVLYRIRSKLVHGRKVHLEADELDNLDFARNILNGVIRKEISNLG